MKHRLHYQLTYLGDTPYLLPFGQAAANLQRGVKLNEIGVFLWNAMQNAPTTEALFEQMVAKYQPSNKEMPQLKEDLQHFLKQLYAYQILPLPISDKQTEQPLTHGQNLLQTSKKILTIGGISIIFHGDTQLFAPEFEAFCQTPHRPHTDNTLQTNTHTDQTTSDTTSITLQVTVEERMPYHPPVGQMLIRTEELTIVQYDDGYFGLCPQNKVLTEWHVSHNGQNAVLYCQKPWHDQAAQEVFHALRIIYLLLAQMHGLFALHSASILYQGKAWLFSGYAGAGKSTHANLWHTHYQAPLLNGDCNLIETTEDTPLVHGMPWCGTSQISTVDTYPLGGIVFIRQNASDYVQTLTNDQKELCVLQRLISPTWTSQMFQRNVQFSKTIASQVPIFRLQCTKEPSAAAVLKEALDSL